MSGIKDLLTLSYWMDNNNKPNLESLLKDKNTLSKEKLHILRELEKEEEERQLLKTKKRV